MEYHLTYKDDKSDKFWQIIIEGNTHTVTYGKTGTKGSSKTKSFDSEEACLKDAEKVKNQKMKKGYVEVGALVTEAVAEGNANVAQKSPAPQESDVVEKVPQVDLPVEKTPEAVKFSDPVSLMEMLAQSIDRNELMSATDYSDQLFTLDLTPEQTEKAYFLKGKLAYKRCQYAAAELDLRNGGAEAYPLLAEMYRQHQQRDHAYYYYEQINTFESLFAAGMLGKTHDFEVAKKYFQAALIIGEKENPPQLWDLYLKLGAVFHENNKVQAELYYKKAIETGKAGLSVYNNLAILYLDHQEIDLALGLLNEAIDKFPEESLSYYNKACLLARSNKLDEAFDALQLALYHGYDNFRHISSEQDFELLSKREDYKKLIEAYRNYGADHLEEGFKEHPERFRDFRLYSYSRFKKGSKLPDYVFKAHNLRSFEVDENLNEVPVELLQLKKLRKVSFMDTSIKHFPEELLDQPYTDVELEFKRITEFPAYLKRLKGLKELKLSSVKFTEIPKEIAHFSALEELLIKHSKITRVDREIASLSQLKELEIRDTALTALPVELGSMVNLIRLHISDNKELTYFPETILLAPNLTNIYFHKNGFPSTEATALCEHAFDNNVDRKVLAFQMAILQLNRAYVAEHGAVKDLLEALNAPVPLVRHNALILLSEQPIESLTPADSEVLVLGKFDVSNTALKKELTDLGYAVAKKYTDKTSHILVGQKPGDKLNDLLDKPVVWVTEQLLKAGDDAEAVEMAALSPRRIEQIKMLLRSREATNLMMALELIEESNTASLFDMELFLAYQFTSDAGLKKIMLSMIKAGSNKALQALIVKKFGFKTAAEKKVNEYIEVIAPELGVDPCELAFGIFKLGERKSGVEYLFEHGSDVFTRQVIKSLMEDDTLRIDYDNNIVKLPDSLAEFTDLTKLEVNEGKFKEFPMVITQLVKLEVLDIGNSGLRAVPAEIEQLQGLKELNLERSRFTKFPDAVGSLKKLTHLSFNSNKSLSKISNAIGGLEALEVLDISETKVKALPKDFEKLQKLKVLKICDRNNVGFLEFPEVLTALPNLEELELLLGQIEAFGDNLLKIPALKRIHVYHNYREKEAYAALQQKYPAIQFSSATYYR